MYNVSRLPMIDGVPALLGGLELVIVHHRPEVISNGVVVNAQLVDDVPLGDAGL